MKTTNFLLLALLSPWVAPRWAAAQSCTEDSDCEPEQYCDIGPSVGNSSDSMGSMVDCRPGDDCSAASESAPAQPDVVEETRQGQCEAGGRECTSDSECLPDYYCAFDDVSFAACPPGEDCSDVEPPPPSGSCEHEPYTCSVDADCPEPAVCGEEGECLYRLQVCEVSEDCDPNYECMDVRGGAGDDSSPGDLEDPPSADAKDTSGETVPEGTDVDFGADPADPIADDGAVTLPDEGSAESEVPAEGVANSSMATDADGEERADDAPEARLCFPRLVPCESDEDCSDGWVCSEFDSGPPGWEDVDRACLPPGIAAALAGDLEVEGGRGQSDSSENAETPTGAGQGTSDDDGVEAAEQALGTQGGSEGSAPQRGCSVRGAGAGDPAWSAMWWLLGVLGFALRPRR
jgi:MYXO-CTERM domain-containing protein